MIFFYPSLDFSEISEGRRVKSFRKFPKGEGLNRLRKFTGQGTCSHINSEVFLGNMRCFWDSVEEREEVERVRKKGRHRWVREREGKGKGGKGKGRSVEEGRGEKGTRRGERDRA